VENKPIIETRNDFSAVNGYVDNLIQRQKDLLSFSRLVRARHIVLTICALIVSLSIAWFFVEWSRKMPAQPVKRDGQVNQLIEQVSKNIKAPDSSEVTKDDNVKSVSVNFTVFHTVSLDDNAEIVTGWRFSPDDIDVPKSQNCYFGKKVDGNKSNITNLAGKELDGAVNWYNVDGALVRLGEQHCRFK
jgi:hypothetical protein